MSFEVLYLWVPSWESVPGVELRARETAFGLTEQLFWSWQGTLLGEGAPASRLRPSFHLWLTRDTPTLVRWRIRNGFLLYASQDVLTKAERTDSRAELESSPLLQAVRAILSSQSAWLVWIGLDPDGNDADGRRKRLSVEEVMNRVADLIQGRGDDFIAWS